MLAPWAWFIRGDSTARRTLNKSTTVASSRGRGLVDDDALGRRKLADRKGFYILFATGQHSNLTQWKRAGLITLKSLDRNQELLYRAFFVHYLKFWPVICS